MLRNRYIKRQSQNKRDKERTNVNKHSEEDN